MSSHFGSVDNRRVNIDCWLIVSPGHPDSWPRRPGVRVTAVYPKLARTERAINLKVQLPIALFEAPSIVASITVESPAQPVTIDAQAITDAVRAAIGMDIDLRIANPGEGE